VTDMNLYLLRHGLATEPSVRHLAKDSERSLTPEGKRKMRQIAKAMQALELSFDVILTSPYLRARQTAEIIADAFRADRELEPADELIPGASAKDLVHRINSLKPAPESLLLVGHEPSMSQHISLWITGDLDSSITLKKGGLCKLTVESLHPSRCATLEWLLTPKQLGLMG
jgi:phosphohistidine phosphatase